MFSSKVKILEPRPERLENAEKPHRNSSQQTEKSQ